MKILLFALLMVTVIYNINSTYKAWTEDCYIPSAKWIITFCGVGSILCFLYASWEMIK